MPFFIYDDKKTLIGITNSAILMHVVRTAYYLHKYPALQVLRKKDKEQYYKKLDDIIHTRSKMNVNKNWQETYNTFLNTNPIAYKTRYGEIIYINKEYEHLLKDIKGILANIDYKEEVI